MEKVRDVSRAKYGSVLLKEPSQRGSALQSIGNRIDRGKGGNPMARAIEEGRHPLPLLCLSASPPDALVDPTWGIRPAEKKSSQDILDPLKVQHWLLSVLSAVVNSYGNIQIPFRESIVYFTAR